MRWRPGPRWSVGLAGEHSEADFTHQGAFDRSNSGDAPVAEVRFRGNRLGFQAGRRGPLARPRAAERRASPSTG